MLFSLKIFLTDFSALHQVQVRQYLSKNGLTKSPLPNLFGCQCDGGEQPHQYTDNYLSHSDRGGELGIDVEANQKVYDQLNNTNKCIVTGGDTICRLIQLNVSSVVC
jgi:hypothetical protein